MMLRRLLVWTVAGLALTVAAATTTITLLTADALRPTPDLAPLWERSPDRDPLRQKIPISPTPLQYLDSTGRRLNVSYEDRWNHTDVVALHQLPQLLRDAFITSEDKRFHTHQGVDWLARLHAATQNIAALRVVRGASTISEQVVRMHHERPRSVWSRWLEGFEAARLEQANGKLAVLEFYLNQVPYAARRRGVVQAARYYFDRAVDTLNEKEMLALAVLVRSPRWLDPETRQPQLERAIADLAGRMSAAGLLGQPAKAVLTQGLDLRRSDFEPNVAHFLRFVAAEPGVQPDPGGKVTTALNLDLQHSVQSLLDGALDRAAALDVGNGAVLVVDHAASEVIAWVVGHAGRRDRRGNAIDAVLVPRQPGSALKPLLYAAALERGWTAATLIDDLPLDESVGSGLHAYRNYSRRHYGPISLREALGNSLNIPAVRTVQFVGPSAFLAFLDRIGIRGLDGHPNVYGDGLALGNGEVTLYELVQAYTVLARMGDYRPLSVLPGVVRHGSRRVLSEDAASLIADILSDPDAREKEFGRDSVLDLPQQTAVKTGTSSDYRDAWALGFNDRYTVGVWMGNLDYTPMQEVTGARGPALVMRAVFNEVNRHRDPRPLYRSGNLVKVRVCVDTGLASDGVCEARDEWFLPDSLPGSGESETTTPLRLRTPSNGLMLAMDPRIPDDAEYFRFTLSRNVQPRSVTWYVNDQQVATTRQDSYDWKIVRGEFSAYAEVRLDDQRWRTDRVRFSVQ